MKPSEKREELLKEFNRRKAIGVVDIGNQKSIKLSFLKETFEYFKNHK